VNTRLPRAVWLVVVVGIAARLAFACGYWVDKPLTHDEREYLLLARNVADGRGFTYAWPDGTQAPGEHFGRAPVYPLFLAGIICAVAPGSPIAPGAATGPADEPAAVLCAVRLVQAVLGGGVVGLIAWIAGCAAGARAATASAVLSALYPPLVWMPAYVLSETLYSMLALGCVALLMITGPRAWVWMAAGALAGAAVLTRPALLFFLPLAASWLWLKRGLLPALLVALACTVVVAPWAARNVRLYHRVVLVASEGGITFWTGNNQFAIGEGDMAANPGIKQANLALRERHPGLTPEELELVYYREALAFIRAQPGAWALLMARKVFYTVVPIGPSYRLHSPLYLGASVLSYLGVLPFGILGLIRLVRRGSVPVPLVLLAASSVLVCLVFFPQERFRIPVVDPALLVFAASWWALRG
jgi:4-amino-4-deoxy-L-arabinose transferase-like glycosyltransferase